MPWKPDKLLKAILVWTAISLILIWLPLVRGLMDGDTYQWGNSLWGFDISGHGTHGHYWVLVLQALFGIALLYMGWRGAKKPFHWLLLLWHISLAYQAFYNSLTYPEEYRFRGDTLGVDVSLAWVGPLLYGGFALLSVVWVVRDLKQKREHLPPAWSRTSGLFLLIAAGLLPIQFYLLRYGVPHGPNDQIGVILTMLQWILINLGLYPWVRRTLNNSGP
jgi:hypothetical protein